DAVMLRPSVVDFVDLATGSALWKTPLVGNQIELTMFGEIAREPFMGGLLLEDGIVYACTNLGVVAAVRAADGRVKWVTEYRSNNERVYRGRYRRAGRRPVWDRNPVCAFEKRLLVTPLDSNSLYAFSTLTGKMLQKTSSHLGKFLLGIHEDRLVLCGSSITTLPARDLTNTALQRTHRLMGEVRARPALVREGVVYATDSSLYFQPLGMGRRVGERSLLQSSLAIPLVRFRDGILPPQRPRREGPFGAFAPSDDDDRVFDGRVKVLPDRVLVTSTYWLSCYLARPEADEGGEREPR
ncbi:MAG: PQQ-binding-like beta-propeller repeat protein, partial [Planctomycetota bacterium]